MGDSDAGASPLERRAAYAGGMAELVEDIELRIEAAADPRQVARRLYFAGWRVSSIARHLGIKRSTVNSWKQRDAWEKVPRLERVEIALEARIVQLIAKEVKGNGEYKELDALMRQLVQAARVRRYEQPGGNETDLNPNIARRNAGPKRRPEKNAFSEESQARIVEAFQDSLFDYQKVWYRNGHQRTRAILKSRQIGATWYFAREALIDAIQTGRNQIFLSASKSQAHVFKQYIVQFAREACGVELTGDPIVLPNGAHLYFLGTNARTAQGYHGNFYFDEFFWTQNFTELNKVASGMALHKRWRKTYFSTPSAMTHQAYPFWTGEAFNRRRAASDQVRIDVSHQRLSSGFTGEDKIWRQIVTIMDAAAGGCDLFDIDELRDFEYSPDQFDNLLMCNFIDDSASVFPLADMQRGMVDSWVDWNDYKPFTARPFGHRPVWIGYDPSLTGDSAGCSVIAPPLVPGGTFRILERHQWRGKDFAEQAKLIREMTARFNVQYIGIDTTGMGVGVYPLVKQFFPAVTAISYSPEVKTRMVLKAQHIIRAGRLQFDAGWTDIAQSFMAIRKILTPSGRAVTYDAGRSQETGHADLAWSVMHALDYEPFEGSTASNTSFMEIT